MIRVGVIGLGDISKVHIPILKSMKNIQLIAVCDHDKNQWFDDQSIHFYTDYVKMLDHERLDSVHICLPHYLHQPIAMECVARGIHIFLEKPMGINLDEAYALSALEKNNVDIKMNLCLQNRLNNTSIKMKELIETKKYGNILGIKGIVAWHRSHEYYTSKPWRGCMEHAGGGVMINQSIHTLDLMQWMVGKIQSIRGNISQMLDYNIEVEDTASAHIAFENGCSGMFYATNANPYNASVEIEAILEKGRLVIRDNILYLWDEDGDHILVEDERVEGTKFYYGASHKKLIRLFYEVLEKKHTNYIPLCEGIVSMQMIDAIIRSSHIGKKSKMEEKNG